MNLNIVHLLFTSVSLSSIAQVAFKTGMPQPRVAAALDGDSRVNAAVAVLFSLWVLAEVVMCDAVIAARMTGTLFISSGVVLVSGL